MRRSLTTKAMLLVVASVAFVPLLKAQGMGGGVAPGGSMPANMKPAILQDVSIEQKLNSQVPLDLTFRDEYGQTVTLQKYFGSRPVILSLVYFNCPMLCPEVVQGMAKTLNLLKLDMGKDFNVLTVSFDPKDTPKDALEKKKAWLAGLDQRDDQGSWHFLTGDPEAIKALTQAVGFRYAYDPKTHMFSHATGIMLLTPEGKVSKYFYGADYSPTDLRFGLVEASHHKIGSPVDEILLFCCKYDAVTGKYDLLVRRVLAIAGVVTIVLLGSFLLIMFRVIGRKKNETKESVAA